MTSKNISELLLIAAALTTPAMKAESTDSIAVQALVTATLGSGDFAPYYIASNDHGLVTQSKTALLAAGVEGKHTFDNRVIVGWGAQLVANYASNVDYMRYNADLGDWVSNPQHPARGWLQQAWGRIDYRSLFLQAGLRNTGSALVDDRLSSGDIVLGCNTRPIPGVGVGFNDFQPIPFTNGWVEINGKVTYGKYTDNDWLENHFNYYSFHVDEGSLFLYRNCYFRTKSSKPLALTIGMQAASSFGGTTHAYKHGEVEVITKHPQGIIDALKLIIPTGGGEAYYTGSTLGSWDIMLRYRLKDGSTLRGYMSKPWETGSGVGFLNGFDALWGLEWRLPAERKWWVEGAVIEYLDFTNQSGPIHFDPIDIPGCTFPVHTDGQDDYYNNYTYNAWAYYGMSLGSPMIQAPIYNLDGYLGFVNNRVRGFHLGVEGHLLPSLSYRFLTGYRKGWGTPWVPLNEATTDYSAMLEGSWSHNAGPGVLGLNIKIAIDRGSMYGNQFGVQLGATYNFRAL